MSEFADWVGRSEDTSDVLDPTRSNALSAALGQSAAKQAGDPLPLLHH